VIARRALRWLITIVVIAAVLVAADRISASVAGRVAQRDLAKQAAFVQPPTVRVGGFPFLTQAVAGRYDQVEVRDSQVELDGVQAADFHATLRGVHLPLAKLFGGKATSLPIDSLDGAVTFTYAELAQLVPVAGLTLTPPGDSNGLVAASATLAIPGLGGASLPVSAQARVDYTATGGVHLVLTDVRVAGQTVPSAVVNQLTSLFAAPLKLPALPYGLQIDAVSTGADGVVVTGSAKAVVISAS
jgi:hypothetical protein